MSAMRHHASSRLFRFIVLGAVLTAATWWQVNAVRAASSTIVISEFRVRGPQGGNDEFIELLNVSSSAVDISGWRINGSNSSGTTSTRSTIPAGTFVPAGCRYLLANTAASGYSGGVTPDRTYATGVTDDGGIAVLDAGGAIVDQVGMSAGSAYGEGTRLTSLGTSNQDRSRERSSGAQDTDDNAGDFQLLAPSNPQNSASACLTGGSGPSGTGAATPNPVEQGQSTLLTVTTTEGAPAAAVTSVIADLSPIGGLSVQPFSDAGTNGDVTAGDGIFSFLATVAPATTIGNTSLSVSIADALARSGAATIAVTVQEPPPPPAPFVAIHDIQGPGQLSPYVGQRVRTRGIVTARRFNNGYFIQTPDAEVDGSSATSEGIFVFTSSAPPAAAAIGALLEVEGTVAEFVSSSDPYSLPITELTSSTFSVLATDMPLPAPSTLTGSDMTPSGGIEQLERFEHMRVFVATATVTAPTQGSISEANATATSNGVFFVTLPGNARPFREPGIETPLPAPAGAPANVPFFDANPENLRVDSDGQIGPSGPTRIDVAVGQTIDNLVGVLDYGFRAFTVLPDPTALPTVTGTPMLTAVRPALPHEFTVGTANLQRFFDTVNDAGISDVALTAAALETRLAKASLQIRQIMQTPDIVGVVEVENLSVLQTLATRINDDAVADGSPNPNYVAYLEEGNDPGGIDVGFLVKSARVSVVQVTQVGKNTTYIDPNDNQPDLLNDRPSLILEAVVGGAGRSPSPITVIVNHLRSLSGVDDPADGNRVRTKRRAQAEFLADVVQARQVANPGERIVLVGDFNAFAYNDGYVDVIGTIVGDPTPADQVTLASADLVNPNLVRVAELAPADQQYSYSFGGNAQELDHTLVTGNLLSLITDVAWGRNNADFPETMRNLTGSAARTSDHDPMVVYFSQQQATSTTLSASPAVVFSGQQTTLTATVSAGTTVSTGSVTFLNGPLVLGTVPVTDGIASLDVVLPLGVQTITAQYTNGEAFGPSSAEATVTVVTVAPTVVDDQATTLEGRSVVIAVLANDNDSDGGTLTVTGTSAPTLGTVLINADQTVTYSSAPGVYGTDSFSYSVADGQGGEATATVTVVVSRLGRFVVLGKDEVWVRDGSTVVTGDIGAAQAQPNRDRRHNRWRDDDMPRDHRIEVLLGEHVSVLEDDSRVVGDSVWLRSRSRVQDVYANELVRRSPFFWFGLTIGGAVINGDIVSPVTLPFVALPSMTTATPGTQKVQVQKRQTQVLAPGRYGRVLVRQNATLVLSGGLYEIESLDVEEGATVRYDATSTIRVRRTVETDRNARIVAGAGVDASDLLISVGGNDDDCNEREHGAHDHPGPTVVRIGERNIIAANIVATGGTIWIRDRTDATGAFIGERVRIGAKVTLRLDSLFR